MKRVKYEKNPIYEAILQIKGHYADYTGNHINAQFTKEEYTRSFFKAIESYGI